MNLLDLLRQDGLKLQRVGSEWKTLCPFHDEKTPSLSIDPKKNLYYCFGCGAKGDAVTWLTDYRKMTMADALQLCGKSQPMNATTATTRAHEPTAADVNKARRVAQLWQNCTPVPLDAEHPARRWAANRKCWHPQVEFPHYIRWHDAWPDHCGAGSIVAAIYADWNWQGNEPPPPSKVELISVDADGQPALDKRQNGRTKRTWGVGRGIVVIGDLRQVEYDGKNVRGLIVAEGVADALSLASRRLLPVVATLGTSNFISEAGQQIVAQHAQGRIVRVAIDNDAAGRNAGDKLCRALVMRFGLDAKIWAGPNNTDPNALLQTEFERIDGVEQFDSGDGWDYNRQRLFTIAATT